MDKIDLARKGGFYLIILILDKSLKGVNAAIIGITVAVLALFVLVALVVVRRRMKRTNCTFVLHH